MQEDYKLIYWVAVTDKGEYTLSENELELLLKSEANGSRFFMLDKVVLNIAFIKEIYRKIEYRNSQFSSLSDADRKYLKNEPKKLRQTKS